MTTRAQGPAAASPPRAAAVVPIILAAGEGRRLGGPKALADVDGRTCLSRTIEACRGAGLARPIVVLGRAAERVRAAVDLADAVVAVSAHPDSGQTSSLKAGLAHLPAEADAFLIYPVDLPLVEATDITPLVSAFCVAPGCRIVIPSWQHRRGHPVLVDRALAAEILALSDDQPARAVINRHAGDIVYVEASGPDVITDMDTPEDHRRCVDLLRARRAGHP